MSASDPDADQVSPQLDRDVLLIRGDASVAIGTGHIMRCLALAQAWQGAGGWVIFALAQSTPPIEERLRHESARVVTIDATPGSASDSEKLIAVAQACHPAWVVLDGYRFTTSYQRSLRNAQLKTLLIDDNGAFEAYATDIVVNQNIHAHESLYRNREPDTRLLLGTKYAMLRREFASAASARKVAPIAHKLLVSMGGSDPSNATQRVIEAIEQVALRDLEITIVAGGSNPHLASITAAVAKSKHIYRILSNAARMDELMQWADLAISAAGSTCWEYCALALPAVLLAVAENQIANAEALHSGGAAKLLTGGPDFSIQEMAQLITRLSKSGREREALSLAASALVDGHGASRVVAALMREPASRIEDNQ